MKTYIIKNLGRKQEQEIAWNIHMMDSYLNDRNKWQEKDNESAQRWCDKRIEEHKAKRDAYLAEYAEICQPLDAILAEVQKGARARVISGQDILKALCHIEDQLGITKKALAGVKVHVDVYSQIPRAYKSMPKSTQFSAEFRNGHWRLTDICRATCGRSGSKYVIEHTPESKAAVVERYSRF